MEPKLKTAYHLSILSTVLMAAASLLGRIFPELYRDIERFELAWMVNDWINLLVAVPALIVTLVLVRRGSQRARMVWMGLLLFTAYNYTYYLFGATFNACFLLYVLLVVLPSYALIFALPRLNVAALAGNFGARMPFKAVAAFLLVIAAGMGGFEVAQALAFVFNGVEPSAPVLVLTLDLTLVIPESILGMVWLWQRKAWGYLISVMVLVKGIIYAAILVAGGLVTYAIVPDPLLPLWVFITVGSLIATAALLVQLRPSAGALAGQAAD